MEAFLSGVARVNDAVNSAVWGLPGLILLIGTGAMMSPASIQQGEAIPAVAHLLRLSSVPSEQTKGD